LLPTPKASNANGPGMHGDGGADLQSVVHLIPTPRSRDYKGATQRGGHAMNDGMQNTLDGTNTGLKLQPAFVEWMMGYEIDWTNLWKERIDETWIEIE